MTEKEMLLKIIELQDTVIKLLGEKGSTISTAIWQWKPEDNATLDNIRTESTTGSVWPDYYQKYYPK